MEKGLCPHCREVISSYSSICEHCAKQISLKSISEQTKSEKPRKEVYKQTPGLLILEILLPLAGIMIMFYVNIIVGLIVLLTGIVPTVATSKRWKQMLLEYEYAKLPSDVKKSKNTKKTSDEATPNRLGLDELKKLKELLDDGVITTEEFEAKKRQILKL